MVKVGIAGSMSYSVVELLHLPQQHVQTKLGSASRLVARRDGQYVDLMFGLNEIQAPCRPRYFSEDQEILETLCHHTAPRVVVRTHVSWHWYAAGGALVALVVLMIVGLALQHGNAGAMETELMSLRLQVRSLDEELLRYRSTAGTEQNAVQMERSTQQRLLSRVRALEFENAVLKEDMLLLERPIPAAGEDEQCAWRISRSSPTGRRISTTGC